jgi:chromosomal replication initiation ATPase DnaA
MVKPTQIPLSFPVKPQFSRVDFLASTSNQAALSRLEAWPNWQHPVLVLYGPKGCGKSHLASIWQEKIGAGSPHKLVEDLDLLVGNKEAETQVFHAYNTTLEQKTTMLVTSGLPMAQLNFILPDLASRLRSCPSVGVEAPDDVLVTALLVKLFADRQITIGADVLAYCVPRLERSFEAVRSFVESADKAALAAKKPVTIPLVRVLLNSD